MRSLRRAVLLIAVLTGLAGSAMHMQAKSMARMLEERQLKLATTTAMSIAGDELARAEAGIRAGRPAAALNSRDVDTAHGRLRVAVAAERQSSRRHLLRVSVADTQGHVLSSYETVVEVEGR